MSVLFLIGSSHSLIPLGTCLGAVVSVALHSIYTRFAKDLEAVNDIDLTVELAIENV